MNYNDFHLKIDIDKIESKEQFLTFIDVILAHVFVVEYDDKGIITYLNNKDQECKQSESKLNNGGKNGSN